ncbi:juvenile hormone acid O-methyltransferase-like [Dermacentor variabilis]|uniref:juvenile hormone acid O-methyltransferase-like n=1 Tax=Dermacentor variabilis TaxID=34621 RepID=UPI003F5C6607
MHEESEPNHNKPDYDAVAYSENVSCSFPIITKLLNYYNLTFDNELDSGNGQESASPCGPLRFLDVGSGCGQVTMKMLLPNVPDNVERIVGVDVCPNMVSYAREHSSHPKLAYEQLDITGDVSEFLRLYGPFDRLYCFNSLNRVKDQHQAWSNMAKLLKPGGECLLFYGAWYVTPEIWRALARKQRWSRFAELWEGLIPPSQDMGSTEERLNHVQSLARDVGLKLRSCEMAHIYLPLQEWSGMLTALIPGNNTLSAEERHELFKDADEEFQHWLRGRKNPLLADNYVIHGIKPMEQHT